jgi:hypothetical protein
MCSAKGFIVFAFSRSAAGPDGIYELARGQEKARCGGPERAFSEGLFACFLRRTSRCGGPSEHGYAYRGAKAGGCEGAKSKGGRRHDGSRWEVVMRTPLTIIPAETQTCLWAFGEMAVLISGMCLF